MTQYSKTPPSLKPGYFLAQEASSLPINVPARSLDPYFKSFLTLDSAKVYFDQIAGKVDGLDYVNYWYEQADGEMARKIAELARTYDIDMWAGIRWQKQFRDIPVTPAEYIGWTMDESGRIVPALWEQRNHVFDVLNPQAVDWMLGVLEERYWPHVKGVVNGWFFPECSIPCEWPHKVGLKTWTLRAYSPYVFEAWRRYCADHDVRYEGCQVDRFPVPKQHMTGPHPEKTIFISDDRPEIIPACKRYHEISRGPEVWRAWEDFLCGLYHKHYVHRIAERVNRFNAEVSDWRGTCFFSLDSILLDYRDFNTTQARAGRYDPYWPQARRVGVDIRRLLADPEITCLIMETMPSVKEYQLQEENCLSMEMELARGMNQGSKTGFMIHSSAHWGAVGDCRVPGMAVWDDIEEELRWRMFDKYKPAVFSFYSVPVVLVREGAWYNREATDRFWVRVKEYKKSLC